MALTPSPASVVEDRYRYVQWGPVIAGAIAAAALALVLHSFGAAVGLAVSSTAPTWRDASYALVLLSGLYLILVAFAAYGFGGYIAGRVCSSLGARTIEDFEFRDGVHGLLVWGLATLLTGLLALGLGQALSGAAAPSGGPAGAATSVAGESLLAYDLDRLFRSERRIETDMNYTRSEAARILLTVSSHRGVQADDRTHLVRLVSARTGLAPPDAERRVADALTRAKETIERARRSIVLFAFMTGTAALLGAAVAYFAAWAGGRHREGAEASAITWRFWGPLARTH